MPCHACGAELLPGKEFCHICGEPVKPRCGSCGAVLEGEYRFCPDCGAPITKATDSDPGGGDGESLSRFARAMPAPMAEKISATGGSMRGERKVVTVLFCDLAGSTAVAERLDPEEYRELLDRYLEIAFREIYRFEGIVNQLAGDGLMALFGAPIAHEDDPQRAIWAALAIRDAMVGYNAELRERGIELPARIGINTGPVVAGAVGNDLKMDYTAIGDTTNLAARLESLAAPGTVLISDETERLARGFFRVRPAGPFDIKGKAAKVDAFEVIDAVEASSPMAVAVRRGLTPLFGRDEEIAQMLGCFDRLRGELPQLVHLVGDAGSGKSRLIHEFRESLHSQQVTVLEARCSALHQLEPYYPLLEMLRLYFEFDDNAPVAANGARVAAKVGVAIDEVARAYPHLTRLLSRSGYDSAEVPPDELQQEVTQAIDNLVFHESLRAPVVVVFEDLHWADDQSRDLLALALSHVMRARLMVIVSARPDQSFAWHTHAAVTQIHLRPLPDEAVTGIMRSIVGGNLPAAVEQRIRERAEGSPFFVEEITRSLLESGNLRCGADGCELGGEFDDGQIPGSVREVLAARLDSLDPAAKRVAQLAAVLGRQFRRDEIEELADNGRIVDAGVGVVQLLERGVVHRALTIGPDEYRFGESLTQEVAYESLLLKERRVLHERVGVMLERRRDRPTLIAHHYARSDNVAKAVETLLSAATEAEQVPAYRSALDLYRRAWEIAEATATDTDASAQERLLQAALGYCRVTVLYGASEDPLARRAAELSVDLAAATGNASAGATAKTYLGMILTTVPEEFEQGLVYVEAGVEAARQHGDEALAVSTSRALAWNYLLDGRFDKGLTTLDWAMERLRAAGQAERPADIYLSAMMMRLQIRLFSDDLDRALSEALETEMLSQKVGNRTIGSMSRGLVGYVHFMRGEYEEARHSAEQSLATAEEIGVEWGLRRASILAVASHVEIEGTPPDPRLMELAEEGISMGGNMVLTVLPLVEALVGLLKFRRAESLARQAVERSAGRLRVMFARAALGDATLRLGESYWPESESSFRESLRLAEEIGSVVGRAASLNGLGKVAFVRGDLDSARAHFTSALLVGRAGGVGRYARRAERLLHEVAQASGAAAGAVSA
jgi:class 3 adenylate cyclase/tetratricopeptide (TPR) repeat protein